MIRGALDGSAVLLFAVVAVATAQAPTGFVAGVVRDSSGATIGAARVKIQTTSTGLARTIAISMTGDYSFPFLLAGEYEISVEAMGFQRAVRTATVEAGRTTTADFSLTIGDVKEAVNVDAATPQMQYDSTTLGGVVTRVQIEGLPLNGRSFRVGQARARCAGAIPKQQQSYLPVLGAPGGNTGEVAEHGHG
jgi:hypothetical protein